MAQHSNLQGVLAQMDQSPPEDPTPKTRRQFRTPSRAAEKLSAVGAIGQLVTGLASLAIATLALIITIQFKDEDRSQLEFQILPYLLYEIDAPNAKISLTNKGNGPAVIRYVSVTIKDKITPLTEGSDALPYLNALTEFSMEQFDSQQIKRYLLSLGNDASDQVSHVFHPFPGNILSKDEKITITEVPESVLNIIRPNGDFFIKWSLDIQGRRLRNNLLVCYCSISEKSCYITDFAPGSVKRVNSCPSSVNQTKPPN